MAWLSLQVPAIVMHLPSFNQWFASSGPPGPGCALAGHG